MKVVIKFEKEIENCYECPFRQYYSEHGNSGYECTKAGAYSFTPASGILNYCPFLKKDA